MNLTPGSHIYFMGICGTAMASLAGLLKERGFKVSGSDSNPYPPMSTQLEKLGIPILKGYAASNLNPKPDFVIVGNVISASNVEAQELMKLGIPHSSLPKAMGELLIADRHSIVISGTHGKTTTTSLMSWIAETNNLKPGFLIGGIPKNFTQSFQNPKGDYFIIEGDEYDTAFFDKVPKFIHYKPQHVILTSIEFDHADIYKDLDAVKDAFKMLMRLIPNDGHLLYLRNDKNIKSILSETKCKNTFSYGFKDADYIAKIINSDSFEVYFKNELLGSYNFSIPGDYNILNATAAIGLSHQLGWPTEKVKEAVQSFQGVKRRQEILGEPNGILVIEDFAHHPTAVKETVAGIQKKYPNRKVFSVFEPRSATSRRKVFQKDYVEAFKNSHEILLARAYDQSKIDSENRFSSEELISDLKKAGKVAADFSGADDIVSYLKTHAKRGDVVLIMSNGGFDNIYTKLISALA